MHPGGAGDSVQTNQFKVLIHLRPQGDHHGSLPEACRSELRELFDGLLDWEIADGTVTDVGTNQLPPLS
jgi:hypothetical protein